MTWFGTLDVNPPAAIAFFMPSEMVMITNARSAVSASEERIRSSFEAAQRELRRYEQYAPRWDGYRAEPFAPQVLGKAARILQYSEDVFLDNGVLPEFVTTGPASDGSIDVEIKVQDKRVLMTLDPQAEHLKVSSFDTKGANEFLVPLRTKDLGEWLSWLRDPRAVPPPMDQDRVHP